MKSPFHILQLSSNLTAEDVVAIHNALDECYGLAYKKGWEDGYRDGKAAPQYHYPNYSVPGMPYVVNYSNNSHSTDPKWSH